MASSSSSSSSSAAAAGQHALVPYLNNGSNETRIVLAQQDQEQQRMLVTQDQFYGFIDELSRHFKCPFSENVDPSKFGVKIKAKEGERYFMNWDNGPHFGPIIVFLAPHVVYTADMPPHGNLKQGLNEERRKSKFFDHAPEKMYDAEMSVGLSAAPYGNQETDSLGRGVPQGRFQDFAVKLEAIAWKACQTRHPEFLKRVRLEYDEYKSSKCKSCKAQGPREKCVEHDPLTPEQEKTWKEEILPGKLDGWWARVLKPTTRGNAIFCTSTIWTPMDERQKKNKRDVLIDPELLAYKAGPGDKDDPEYKAHEKAFEAGYYMKDVFCAVGPDGRKLPYKEAVLLSRGDLIIPKISIKCDFKYGNKLGKFRLIVELVGWQLLQRGVRTMAEKMKDGFDFTAVFPGLRLEPVDPKILEERAKVVKEMVTLFEEHETADETYDKWKAKDEKRVFVPRPGGYQRQTLPMLLAPPPQPALPAPAKEKIDPKIAEENKRKRLADAAAAKEALLKKQQQQQQQAAAHGKRSSSDAPAAVAAAAATVPAAGPPVDTRASKRQKVTEEPSSPPPESDGDQEIG